MKINAWGVLVVGGGKRTLDDFFSAKKAWDAHLPPPKNVDRLISKYIDRYTKDLFLTTNLL
jgi:hypothetical protein